MKKLTFLWLAILLAACSQSIPTPNDFPTPPLTVIVELPYNTAVPTFVPRLQLIRGEDMAEAIDFFLIVKTQAIAGDDEAIADSIYYPIHVSIDGQRVTVHSAAEFLQNSRQIFNDSIIKALVDNSEEDLVNGFEGVRVGRGELYFNLFCMDPACTQKSFLITQINN